MFFDCFAAGSSREQCVIHSAHQRAVCDPERVFSRRCGPSLWIYYLCSLPLDDLLVHMQHFRLKSSLQFHAICTYTGFQGMLMQPNQRARLWDLHTQAPTHIQRVRVEACNVAPLQQESLKAFHDPRLRHQEVHWNSQ